MSIHYLLINQNCWDLIHSYSQPINGLQLLWEEPVLRCRVLWWSALQSFTWWIRKAQHMCGTLPDACVQLDVNIWHTLNFWSPKTPNERILCCLVRRGLTAKHNLSRFNCLTQCSVLLSKLFSSFVSIFFFKLIFIKWRRNVRQIYYLLDFYLSYDFLIAFQKLFWNFFSSKEKKIFFLFFFFSTKSVKNR